MTRVRRSAGIVTAAALTFALAACGGGSAYCDAIEAADEQFSGMDSLDPTDVDAITDAQGKIAEIADAAPDDVKDKWQNVADAFQAIVDADGDMTAIDPEALEGFSTMEQDMEDVATQVQEECDIDIS